MKTCATHSVETHRSRRLRSPSVTSRAKRFECKASEPAALMNFPVLSEYKASMFAMLYRC
jgi:hypothetical protein